MNLRLIPKGMNLAECAGGLICWTCSRSNVGRTLTLVVTLLLFSISTSPLSLEDTTRLRHTDELTEVAYLVTWNVGDTWEFDIELDAVMLVEDSPDLAGSSLELLYGDATITVAAATLHNVSGQMLPSYRLEIDAYATGAGRFPEPNTGIFASGELLVSYQETRWVRMSDLAVISRVQSLDLDFDAFGIWTTGIADFEHAHQYQPPQEVNDFPMLLNETWNSVSLHTETWTGNGGPVEISEDVVETEEVVVYNVAEIGQSPANFAGCEQSYRVWWNNTNGDLLEDRWWCPAIGFDVYWWTDDIALEGVDEEFWLTDYIPAELTEVQVNLETNVSALNQIINVTVTGPVGQSGALWHHANMYNFTLENGMATLQIQAGNRMDDTPTSIDWATHGIIACVDVDTGSMICGASTLTLEGSAIGALLREDAIERSPLVLEVGHETAQRLGLSFRF